MAEPCEIAATIHSPASAPAAATVGDRWSRWLLHGRHGNDAAAARAMQPTLLRFADRVIDGAAPGPGAHLIDIGSGTGLVGLRALERLGSARLFVTFTDRSAEVLAEAQAAAEAAGWAAQCRFLRSEAEDLAGIAEGSADCVTSRAALAYVGDKARAFRAIVRLLRPGGRLSIAEPLLRESALPVVALRQLLSAGGRGAADPLLPLLHRWRAAQFPDTEAALEGCPLTNFTAATLAELAAAAGLRRITLDDRPRARPAAPLTWEAFINTAPHPLAPTLAEILRDAFSAAESAFLERHLRPAVEAGGYGLTERVAYLTAVKPEAGEAVAATPASL
ncbi:class I SAM-dependent methyltransferase [Acidisoma sp. C75]